VEPHVTRYQQAPQTQQLPPKPEAVSPIATEANMYIAKLKAVNDRIAEPEMSTLIGQIEGVTSEIFAAIAERTTDLQSVRRFMSYYLPTALKLMETYANYEAKQVQTPGILQTKEKIKASLERFVTAFLKLHDSIYFTESMDVMNEISAMESRLASEGVLVSEDDVIKKYLDDNEGLPGF